MATKTKPPFVCRDAAVIAHQSLAGCRCPYCRVGHLVFQRDTLDNRCEVCGETLVTEFEFKRREKIKCA